MKKIFLMLVLAVGLLAGCGSEYVPVEEVAYTDYVTLIEEELYYIPHQSNQRDFPSKYKTFLTENPDLKVIDVEVDPMDDSHNTVAGYFIFAEVIK